LGENISHTKHKSPFIRSGKLSKCMDIAIKMLNRKQSEKYSDSLRSRRDEALEAKCSMIYGFLQK
jgi:hypothetical protein